jgi:LuxR family transcriptional regulator, maltose regulon positive regulatory protein
MHRSFRFAPPEPRPASLTRPRLLRVLLGRWEHRVTTVVGGAGLGKTTLLAQAVAENGLAPRGEDVWIGLTVADADGDLLARDLLDAVASAPDGGPAAGDDPPRPGAVADAIWARYPTAVCLVVDDGHLLPAGSPGATWLAGLVEVLPANGHLVVAGRVAPALPLGRLAAHGEVLRLAEDDLRFSSDELAAFAARRGVAVDRVGGTGGWPAMAELAASVEGDLAGDFLWEEVLEPLGPERRRVLAVLVDLGGADDDLAGAALGAPVALAEELDGVPLIAQGGDGWRVPHPLWKTVGSTALAPDDRRAVRRRAAAHLVADGRYDEAFTLAREGGLDDLVPEVMRAACLGPHRPPVRRMDRWLADMPAGAAGTSGAALVTGLRAAVTAPATATEPLRAAIDLCRRADDVAGELAAIALLGRLAWWRSDTALLAELFPRLLELEAAGEPLARALAGIGRAVVADLIGDDDDVLGHLDAIAPGVLDPAWEAMAAWLRATTLAGRGDPDAAIAVLDTIPPSPDPAFRLTVEGTRLAADWALGHVDEVAAALPSLIDRVRAAGVVQNVLVGLSQAAFASGTLGDLAAARRFLADACRVEAEARLTAPARLALAEAAVLTAAGDEAGAARRVVAAMDGHAIGTPGDRRLWRNALSLTYVLVPECRAAWEAAPLHGTVAQCRRLAAAVVALRERAAGPDRVDAARRVADELDRAGDLDDPARIRAGLHHRFAVELAVGLEAAGRPQGGVLLEALGPAGRKVVRSVAAERSGQARPARSLLAAVPAPPPHTTDLGVLGPLELVRDGQPVTAGDLRRERVRALLAFLVEHRATDRGSIVAALWPDLDDRAAANNLRVTMTYLLRLLEPWRPARESAYFVRFDGQAVTLVTGDRLRIDADRFDDHLAAAAAAEADGSPSLALEHNLAAVELYRGELHAGVPDPGWLTVSRERARARFVAAAVRAAQLLAGRGDGARAEAVAGRAVEVNPWAEEAFAVLVSVALARGDRSAARLALDRALAALADLGVEPSEETRRLRRRVRGAGG